MNNLANYHAYKDILTPKLGILCDKSATLFILSVIIELVPGLGISNVQNRIRDKLGELLCRQRQRRTLINCNSTLFLHGLSLL